MNKNSNNANHTFTESDQFKYYNNILKSYLGEIYLIEKGHIVSTIPMEDYINTNKKSLNNNSTKANSRVIQLPIPSPFDLAIYAEASNIFQQLQGSRVSVIQENLGPKTEVFTLDYNASLEHKSNVELSNFERYAVRIGVSFPWVSRACINGTLEMKIPAGHSGYWHFDPHVRVSTGTLKTYRGPHVCLKDITATYPISMTGAMDGVLVAVKTRLY